VRTRSSNLDKEFPVSKIAYIIEFTINDGKQDEFTAKAKGYAEATEKNEPGTLGYQWWMQEDGSHCLLQETFESSEALLTHLGNVGPSLPELLAIAPITRFEVLGTASDQAKAALADLGAKHFPHLTGFDR
jgi:quinol monooxygenase YgiN